MASGHTATWHGVRLFSPEFSLAGDLPAFSPVQPAWYTLETRDLAGTESLDQQGCAASSSASLDAAYPLHPAMDD